MNKPFDFMYRWLLIILSGAMAVIAAFLNFTAIDLLDRSATDIGAQLLTLIFFALVIERAVEIYVNGQFGPPELAARRGIRIASNKVKILETALEQESLLALPQADTDDLRLMLADRQKAVKSTREALEIARRELLEVQTESQEKLEKVRADKVAAAARVAVGLSLLVSGAGVRVFSQFLPMKDGAVDPVFLAALPDNQGAFFVAVDVVVTALLLAGGADGIHQIMKRFVVIERDLAG